MKTTFPLIAILAATSVTPLAAQDLSSILNPGNFAERLNMGTNPALARLPADLSDLFEGAALAPGGNVGVIEQITALSPEAVEPPAPAVRSLAPLTSITPVPRRLGARAQASGAPVQEGADLAAMMAEAAQAAPEGANTLVITGDAPARSASIPEAGIAADATPRRSLWQRLFGN